MIIFKTKYLNFKDKKAELVIIKLMITSSALVNGIFICVMRVAWNSLYLKY